MDVLTKYEDLYTSKGLPVKWHRPQHKFDRKNYYFKKSPRACFECNFLRAFTLALNRIKPSSRRISITQTKFEAFYTSDGWFRMTNSTWNVHLNCLSLCYFYFNFWRYVNKHPRSIRSEHRKDPYKIFEFRWHSWCNEIMPKEIKGVASIRDVAYVHPGFAPYLARIRCPKVRCMHPSQWPFWLRASMPKTTLACILFRNDPCVYPFPSH